MATPSTDYWRGDGSKYRFNFQLDMAGIAVYGLTAPLGVDADLSYYHNETYYGPYHYAVFLPGGEEHDFDLNGLPIKITNRNNLATTFRYDQQRLIQITDPANRSITFTYGDPLNPNQVTSVQDSAGVIATYTYDSSARLTKVSYPDGSFNSFHYDANAQIVSVTDTEGKVLEAHTYDGYRRGVTSERAGGVEKITVSYVGNSISSVTNSRGHVTTYPYRTLNQKNVVTGVSGPGCVTCGGRGDQSFVYDTSGRRTSLTDALNNTLAMTYDSHNNVTSRTATVNGTQVKWSYTYNVDRLQNLLTATDPLGNVTTNNYTNPDSSQSPNILSTTTASPGGKTPGSKTSFTYDAKGQLLTITDPLNHVTTLTYTEAGLVQTVKDAGVPGNITTFEYDARGNRTAIIDALTQRTTFSYDAMNRLTTITYPTTPATSSSFTYDHRGRRITATDANGKTTTYAYDDADRVIAVTDPQNGVTQYAYDTEDNLISITDALQRVTQFEYDQNGRVTKTTFPSGLSETYAYDAMGSLTSKTDRKNQTIGYTYDALQRLAHKQYPDGTGVDYTYDLASHLTQVTDPTGTYKYTIDNMGRLTQTSTAYSFIAGKVFTVGSGWDAASNRTSMTDPQNGSTSYVFDTLNRLTSLTNPQRNQFTFAYDVLSRRTQLGRPNSVKSNYDYDTLSRLTSVLHQYTTSKGATTTLDGAAYTYDSAGNRLSRTDQRTNVASNYGYNPLYELTSVTQGTNTVESYSFDAVGNRLTSLNVPYYNYDNSNQLTGQSEATYAYDNDGNLTSKTDASGTTSYSWDFDNRLTRVTLPGGSQVNFKYDPLGRRIQKSSSSATVNYLYDGANVLEEVDNSGNLVARYTQAPGVDEPLAVLRSGTTSYYEADGLGSVTSLSNSSGALANTYTFDSFGKLTASSGSISNPYRYTAREWDSETGLYYYRARYYDPAIGRFINEDPIRFSGGINFYSYALNSPIVFRDPLGLTVHCTYTYTKNGGRLVCYDDNSGQKVVDVAGYAGGNKGTVPDAVNNESYEHTGDTGPLPFGNYNIGTGYDSKVTGPMTLPLTPWPSTSMRNDTGKSPRDKMRIHGDNKCGCQSASEGCIVVPRDARDTINNSGGGVLFVSPGGVDTGVTACYGGACQI